jgi:hypothetical protein
MAEVLPEFARRRAEEPFDGIVERQDERGYGTAARDLRPQQFKVSRCNYWADHEGTSQHLARAFRLAGSRSSATPNSVHERLSCGQLPPFVVVV